MMFDSFLALLLPVASLVGLAVAAWRWGFDSRDGDDWRPRTEF